MKLRVGSKIREKKVKGLRLVKKLPRNNAAEKK